MDVGCTVPLFWERKVQVGNNETVEKREKEKIKKRQNGAGRVQVQNTAWRKEPKSPLERTVHSPSLNTPLTEKQIIFS